MEVMVMDFKLILKTVQLKTFPVQWSENFGIKVLSD